MFRHSYFIRHFLLARLWPNISTDLFYEDNVMLNKQYIDILYKENL